mmetsp:Transcript_1731/g.4021  ORF Transcript_1731/g.4021 Transcript_1731/m.4021 type:complete len:249 (-) Transcript_1731:2270-3016(-)
MAADHRHLCVRVHLRLQGGVRLRPELHLVPHRDGGLRARQGVREGGDGQLHHRDDLRTQTGHRVHRDAPFPATVGRRLANDPHALHEPRPDLRVRALRGAHPAPAEGRQTSGHVRVLPARDGAHSLRTLVRGGFAAVVPPVRRQVQLPEALRAVRQAVRMVLQRRDLGPDSRDVQGQRRVVQSEERPPLRRPSLQAATGQAGRVLGVRLEGPHLASGEDQRRTPRRPPNRPGCCDTSGRLRPRYPRAR